MHPALSVIVFTVASGAGYGLLGIMGVAAAIGLLPPERWLGVTGFALAFGMVTGGLLSSTLHLGHPERAWRAFSQWRSSWLSREAVMAVLTYLPALLLALGWVVFQRAWAVPGLLAALAAGVTVYCTAMIYGSLKPIAQWRNRWVPACFLGLSLAGGAVWSVLLATAFSLPGIWPHTLAVLALLAGWGTKLLFWNETATAGSIATPETATGLGRLGKVRLLEPPHTEPNWLQKEMGFRIARKHAAKLRRVAWLAGFWAPLALVIVAALVPWPLAVIAALVAAVSCMVGILVERWLFFAEAMHTVTLYYGARAA